MLPLRKSLALTTSSATYANVLTTLTSTTYLNKQHFALHKPFCLVSLPGSGSSSLTRPFPYPRSLTLPVISATAARHNES